MLDNDDANELHDRLNPYESGSCDVPRGRLRAFSNRIVIALVLSVSFLVTTITADWLPGKTDHSLWFPLSFYSLPFTIPGMLLVHLGFSGVSVYVLAFLSSLPISLGIVSIVSRAIASSSSNKKA